MKKVLVSRILPEEIYPLLDGVEVVRRDQTSVMSEAEMRAALQEFDGVICTLGDQFSAEVFADVPTPRCKILANFGVGFNHIDTKAAKAAGVTVTNTPGAVTDATADTAMTLMLMSARRAAEGERLVRSGEWEGWHPTQMLGLHLSGKAVGIVGMGRIGQAIARRCHYGFDMAVHYFGRGPKELDFDATFHPDLSEMASLVDALVIAVPGGAETTHLIDAKILAAMRPHGRLINIARGEVVEQRALIEALQNETIGGAGLDVYEFEPDVPSELRDLENVVLLPHLGTATREVRVDMGRMAVRNLLAFLQGDTPPNLV
ncbi:2-hydroxyacid dehydrogenase [Sulfitobacter donghicola]|uniref:2-hydroxyacid dehydrogenase n=1 Tax=Sulfitobacter donghicola DSW-25 = KCTC 12864 = JCM 14565 TaxID=1300350 RepID=A0A073IEQ9_9RHOB|nr:D-glycerate dehydrogenase [Sulfitobacter donghicola]KEJ88853.1 2-hydroxyacid dehydrogenase [Sulfitobacter donghicola DSW-25 = KCTC 12864 = JCM 14565]KIN68651.1 D-isomer specific 2-hydroxyacid dehydrogenase family protein [Sulfitobacter donghicola DSW-25 = KCTC 12864 = JCM 14565]